MRELEKKFGKPHAELEGFCEPPRGAQWLVSAFFRLHKRRQTGEAGFQPLMVRDLTEFADSVLRLNHRLKPLFFRAMEETDNVVLYDHYVKASAAAEEARKEAAPKRPKRAKRR